MATSSRTSQTAKVCLLGAAGSGKTSLSMRLTRDSFSSTEPSTIGAAFQTRVIALADREVKMEIWDTAGQERYRSLAPMYYRGAAGAIVVYDITSRESFDAAKSWVRELQTKMEGSRIVVALAGNKADLGNRRQVERDEASLYARECGIPLFFETSARDNYNVVDLFAAIAEKVPRPVGEAPSPRLSLAPPQAAARASTASGSGAASSSSSSRAPTGTTVGGCCT